jgi:hypothetical protein
MPEGQTGKPPTIEPSVLYHFSEEPGIERFEPRLAAPPLADSVVWAVDREHEYLYLFPRDCPRVTYYATPDSSIEDVERFQGHTTAEVIAAIEAGWLERLRSTELYRYEFPSTGFECTDAGAGYWVCRHAVRPLRVEAVGDLLEAHVKAGVELRIMPSLWPLRDAVVASTLHFSIIRWRNAAPRPDSALPREVSP